MKYCEVKNKKQFLEFIKEQTGVELPFDERLNDKKNLLYTEIAQKDRNNVLTLLLRLDIRYEHHLKNGYFILWKTGKRE